MQCTNKFNSFLLSRKKLLKIHSVSEMAIVSSRFLAMTFFMVIGISMMCTFHGVSAQLECKGGIELMNKCKQYVLPSGPKVPPSADCCAAVKGADIPCLCKYVTGEIEKIVSMDKGVYVCRSCGMNIPAGTKCGSMLPPFSLSLCKYLLNFKFFLKKFTIIIFKLP